MEVKVHSGGSKHQAAGGDHRSTEVDRSGLLSGNHRPEGDIPNLLAGKKIDCFGRPPRRRVAGHFVCRQEEAAIEPVGSSLLIPEFAIDTVILLLVVLSV